MTDDALKALSTELYEAAGSTKPVSQDALVKADLSAVLDRAGLKLVPKETT